MYLINWIEHCLTWGESYGPEVIECDSGGGGGGTIVNCQLAEIFSTSENTDLANNIMSAVRTD